MGWTRRRKWDPGAYSVISKHDSCYATPFEIIAEIAINFLLAVKFDYLPRYFIFQFHINNRAKTKTASSLPWPTAKVNPRLNVMGLFFFGLHFSRGVKGLC